jgi:uncharacterized damage-inducible protein DinB
MNKKELQLFFEYDAWADRLFFESSAALSGEQYCRDHGASFGSIHGTLVHILSANCIWSARWNKRTPIPLKPEDLTVLESVKKQWNTYRLDIDNLLRTISEEALQSPFPYTDFKGTVHAQTLWLQMLHKVNHSSYHRGQAAAMMRMIGVKPAGTDFINYARIMENNE